MQAVWLNHAVSLIPVAPVENGGVSSTELAEGNGLSADELERWLVEIRIAVVDDGLLRPTVLAREIAAAAFG
jgi:hypothetical protein